MNDEGVRGAPCGLSFSETDSLRASPACHREERSTACPEEKRSDDVGMAIPT